jgi:hypothetical protein
MAIDVSIREEPETNSKPWETVPFEPAGRTVPDANGRERPLTPYEQSRVDASAEDTEMRRQAAAAQRGGSIIDAVLKGRRVAYPLNTGEDAPFTVTPSINELRVTSLTADETELGVLKTSIEFLKSTRESLERVSTAYEALRADPMLTPEARTNKISAAAEKAYERACGASQKAEEAITKQIEHVENELRTPLTTAAHTPGMSELRSVLRNMTQDQRRKVVQDAIAADHPSKQQQDLINAALGGHYLISGMDENMHQTLTLQLNQKRSPHLVRRLEQLQKSKQIVQSVHIGILSKEFEGAQRATFRKAKTLQGISERTAAALAAINGG